MTAAQSCSYCGLPLANGWWNWRRRVELPAGGGAAQESPQAAAVYCCSGCRFAAEVMAEQGRVADRRARGTVRDRNFSDRERGDVHDGAVEQ